MSVSDAAADTPKGTSDGPPVPGLGPAGRIALDLAPELGRWLLAPDAAPVVAAVQEAIKAATGAEDPAAQAAVLADPDRAVRLRIALAGIAAASAAAADARLAAQVTDAQMAAVQRAAAGGVAAWGAPVISLVVLATFGTVMWLVLLHAVPPGSETVLNVLLGTLAAMATNVVGYWVGSSAGSARKDERLAQKAG